MKILQVNKLIISGICLLLFSCTTRKAVSDISPPGPYLSQPNNGLIYDAKFQYKDFQASGILVLKKPTPDNYHVVLLSKFGPTLMEFTLNENELVWVKKFDQLDGKSVKKLIERDFRIILLSMLENPDRKKAISSRDSVTKYMIKKKTRTHVEVEKGSQNVLYAENRGLLNPFKTKAWFHYGEADFPQNIVMKHNNINLSLELNLLKINHAQK